MDDSIDCGAQKYKTRVRAMPKALNVDDCDDDDAQLAPHINTQPNSQLSQIPKYLAKRLEAEKHWRYALHKPKSIYHFVLLHFASILLYIQTRDFLLYLFRFHSISFLKTALSVIDSPNHPCSYSPTAN